VIPVKVFREFPKILPVIFPQSTILTQKTFSSTQILLQRANFSPQSPQISPKLVFSINEIQLALPSFSQCQGSPTTFLLLSCSKARQCQNKHKHHENFYHLQAFVGTSDSEEEQKRFENGNEARKFTEKFESFSLIEEKTRERRKPTKRSMTILSNFMGFVRSLTHRREPIIDWKRMNVVAIKSYDFIVNCSHSKPTY
jgi:hypothetical protein